MPTSRNRVRLKICRNRQTKARRVLRQKDILQQSMNARNAVEEAQRKEKVRKAFILMNS